MKRLFIIVASIVFLLGIGIGAYFLLRDEPTLTVDDNQFGSADDVPYIPSDGPGTEGPVQAGEVVTEQLVRITPGPVALGAVAVALPSQAEGSDPYARGETEIRYIERASGNVYAYRFHERTLERISNRTLPGVQEAAWLSDGSLAFARFLSATTDGDERIETYALPATGEGGYFLDRGLGQVSVSGTTTLMTLLPTTQGSIATLANTDGTNARTLFSSSLSALTVHLSDGPFIVATKPSVHLDGYAFTVGTGGSFSRILGPYRGLSVLPSPSGNLVLFTYIENRALRMGLLDRRDGTIESIPLATLAEKCVWANGEEAIYCGVPKTPSGTLPDDWHQGAVTFADRLWMVDLTANVANYLLDISGRVDSPVDMVGLSVDGRNDVLVFKNRADGSLWAYDI